LIKLYLNVGEKELRTGLRCSIIIPTQNEGKSLKFLLRSLQNQSLKPTQILVVDSSSQGEIEDLTKSFNIDFLKIEPHKFDHGGTRNLAAERANGDILIFLTQDILIKENRCIEKLVQPLQEQNIAASYARQIPKKNANPIERFARCFNYPPEGEIKGIKDLSRLGIKTFFFSNVCSAIKKKIFEEIGGFPERIIMNEDMYLAAKLLMKGYKISYQPEAVVYHSHNYSLGRQFERYFDIGVFFGRNVWIKNLANSEREGIKYLKEEIQFLLKNKQINWIPYALVDTTIRFLGYRMGLLEKWIPSFLKKGMSLNKEFWVNNNLL
jgi:rhamnosyltransferase